MKLEARDPATEGTVRNVLVVDDSEDNADLVAELLRTSGHSVRVANLGADALKLVDEERPDVVLLDVGLPDMDGYEVAAAIRSRFGAQIRLVALTGFSGLEFRNQAKAAGFDAFITKPCGSTDLERALSAMSDAG